MTLNEPQVWTLIGVFAAMVLGGMTLMTTQFTRVIRAEIGGLRGDLKGDIAELRGELKGEMGELRGEVRALSVRIDALDTEVASLAKRMWRDGD